MAYLSALSQDPNRDPVFEEQRWVWNPTFQIFLRVQTPSGTNRRVVRAWRTLLPGTQITDVPVSGNLDWCREALRCDLGDRVSDVGALSDDQRRKLEQWRSDKAHFSLVVAAAVPGEGLRESELAANAPGELIGFLLEAAQLETPTLPKKLLPALSALGVCVQSHRLPVRPRLRCEVPVDPDASLPIADQLEVNPSASLQFGQHSPWEVDARGDLAQELREERPIFWLTDFRTGVPYPYWPSSAAQPHAFELLGGEQRIDELPEMVRSELFRAGFLRRRGDACRQSHERIKRLAQAGDALKRNGYVGVPNAIPSRLLLAFQAYIRDLERQGYLRMGDGQCAERLNAKDNTVASMLRIPFEGILQEMLGSELISTFTYLVIYQNGAELRRHTDRDQCLWNISLCIDADSGQVERCRGGRFWSDS